MFARAAKRVLPKKDTGREDSEPEGDVGLHTGTIVARMGVFRPEGYTRA
jgi:hypothetical protein